MPAIARGSSARLRRHQPSEDNIEAGDPTQHSRTEDVEDPEEAQSSRASRRKSKPSKATRTGGSSTARRRDGDEGASDEEDNEQDGALAMDIKHFKDRPLSKADARKISGVAQDWEQMKRNLRSSAIPLVEQIAVAMAEAGENKDGEAALKDLEQTDLLMRELLDLQAELAAHEDSLVDLANNVAQGEDIDDIVQRYATSVEHRNEAWNIKTTRQKYAKDDDYVRFKSSVYEVQHPDEGMPPVTDFIPAEEGDDDDDDDDIAVGGVSQNYTCPLTLTILVKPVTSQVCRHSFSKASVEDYLQSNRSVKKKCPAAGCSKYVSLLDFVPNPELEKRVQAHVRREQRRQAEADSGEENVEEIID